MTTTTGYSQQDPDDSASEYRAKQFQIERTLARVRTIIPVKVIAVNGGGGAVAAPPTVNVQPLVQVIDGQGNVTSHGTINNIPVWRLQSAWGSLIVDPVAGDVGAMGVCDRDISVVKNTAGKESQPGSRRKYDLADGIYFGGLFGSAPTQYVRFTENGVEVVSGADGIKLNGLVINQQGQVAGNLPVTGALELGGSIEALA